MKKILAFLVTIGAFMTGFSQENPLVLILLGAPGAGKGTHATELNKTYQIPHISTGDLLRENVRSGTELGKKAEGFIAKGELVPDELVLDILYDRIAKYDCKKGFILDGFPRTLSQAEALDKKIANKDLLVLNLDIADEDIVKRLSGRIMCKNCGTPYNKLTLPPKKENVCDKCEGELYQRKDDMEEIVKARLNIYHKQTEPLIDYYKKNAGHFVSIDSSGNKEEVLKRITTAIDAIK